MDHLPSDVHGNIDKYLGPASSYMFSNVSKGIKLTNIDDIDEIMYDAITNGYIDILKNMSEHYTITDDLLDVAKDSGRIPVIIWLLEYLGYPYFDWSDYDLSESGYINIVNDIHNITPSIKSFIDNYGLPSITTRYAFKNKDYKLVGWLDKNGLFSVYHAAWGIIEVNDLRAFNMLLKKHGRTFINNKLIDISIRANQIDMFNKLTKLYPNRDHDVSMLISKYGSLDMMIISVELGYRIDPDAILVAVENDKLDIMWWLFDNNGGNDRLITVAIASKNIDAASMLINRGATITIDAIRAAIVSNDMNLLLLITNDRPPVDTLSVLVAITHSNDIVLEWILNENPKVKELLSMMIYYERDITGRTNILDHMAIATAVFIDKLDVAQYLLDNSISTIENSIYYANNDVSKQWCKKHGSNSYDYHLPLKYDKLSLLISDHKYTSDDIIYTAINDSPNVLKHLLKFVEHPLDINNYPITRRISKILNRYKIPYNNVIIPDGQWQTYYVDTYNYLLEEFKNRFRSSNTSSSFSSSSSSSSSSEDYNDIYDNFERY